MNNDSIGLSMKLRNQQIYQQNEQNSEKDKNIFKEEILQNFLFENSSNLNTTLQKTPQLGAVLNQNDNSNQSDNDFDSLDIGLSSNNASNHPKISKKSPLFEKFGQYPQQSRNSRLKSPENNQLKNNNLSEYNYPSLSKKNGIYANLSRISSNIYNSCNNSPSNQQNSESGFLDSKMGIQSDNELQDYSPKKNILRLYNYQINSSRSGYDKKQLSHRQMSPLSTITPFHLRNHSEANIIGNLQNKKFEQILNLNCQQSFLPLIDQPQSAQIQKSTLNTDLNETQIFERGSSEDRGQISNGLSKYFNFQPSNIQNVKHPLNKFNSNDDKSLQNCFALIKASSPIKKNRIDIFNDFSTNITLQSKTQESEHLTTYQNVKTQEDNFSQQLNTYEGETQNLLKINGLPKNSLVPLNTDQDKQFENSSKIQKEYLIRKGSRENSHRLISSSNPQEFLRKKIVLTTPQTSGNTIGNLIQNTQRDESEDQILNLQFEKIEIKKQSSNKISSAQLDFQQLKHFNTISNDEPTDEVLNKLTINQPIKIHSQRSRKPNSVHISSSEKQKRAESAKNKTNQYSFQNALTKKNIHGLKYEQDSARFIHPKRKVSLKINELTSDIDKQKGKQMNLQSTQINNNKLLENQAIDNLYNPQLDEKYKTTEKICNKIQGMFYKQKEIYEKKYKRKMTANQEEIDLLKELNIALEEIKSSNKYSQQIKSNCQNESANTNNKYNQ